jgi:hypothetical protein
MSFFKSIFFASSVLLLLSGCSVGASQKTTLTVAEAQAAFEETGNCNGFDKINRDVDSSTEVICLSGGAALSYIEIFDSPQALEVGLSKWECDSQPDEYFEKDFLIGNNWYISFAEKNLEKVGLAVSDFQSKYGGEKATFSSFCS